MYNLGIQGFYKIRKMNYNPTGLLQLICICHTPFCKTLRLRNGYSHRSEAWQKQSLGLRAFINSKMFSFRNPRGSLRLICICHAPFHSNCEGSETITATGMKLGRYNLGTQGFQKIKKKRIIIQQGCYS